MRARLATRFELADVLVEPALLHIVGPRGVVHVEPRAMDVLVALAQRAPYPASRSELMLGVWGHACVTDGVLTRCVSMLRDHFGDDRSNPRYIQTLSKRGYRLVPPVAFLAPRNGSAPTRLMARAEETMAIVSLAVLPFVDLSSTAVGERTCDAFTELLIANLSSNASLAVVSRTTSMYYKHARRRLQDIARELDVDYVIEGSLLREASRFQTIVQLIDARTDVHLWTRSYVRGAGELLDTMNEVAGLVTVALDALIFPP